MKYLILQLSRGVFNRHRLLRHAICRPWSTVLAEQHNRSHWLPDAFHAFLVKISVGVKAQMFCTVQIATGLSM